MSTYVAPARPQPWGAILSVSEDDPEDPMPDIAQIKQNVATAVPRDIAMGALSRFRNEVVWPRDQIPAPYDDQVTGGAAAIYFWPNYYAAIAPELVEGLPTGSAQDINRKWSELSGKGLDVAAQAYWREQGNPHGGGGGGGAVQPGIIAGRIRVEQGRFRNNAGWLALRAISEFSFVHLCRTGRQDEVKRRLAVGQAGGCNVARIFMRCVNLFTLNDSQEGYWPAVEQAVGLCNAAGVYANLVICVDAKNDQGMDSAKRQAFVRAVLARYGQHIGVLLSLSNEPYQNGFGGALDAELLEYAALTAQACGHRDFIVGDAHDGDDPDASAETIAETRELARHSNIVVIHSSRKGGATPEGGDGRMRRWIDHLEGYYDVLAEARKVNGNVAGVHEEPMGHASQQWVPIPGRSPDEREYDPECALAAAVTAHCIGVGYCYHRISEQNDGTPGLDLIGKALAGIPSDPSWHYVNDSWAGSATRGFTWRGGKVRTWTNGADALVLAYGHTKGSVNWANGYEPTATLHDGPHCTVWKAKKMRARTVRKVRAPNVPTVRKARKARKG